MKPFEMTGKIAVVNGASRGIGEAIARGLAACGAQLVLSSRSQESVQEVADDIVAGGGKAVARACHAGHLDEIDALFNFVRDEFGRLDILINNAATNPYYGPAAGLSPLMPLPGQAVYGMTKAGLVSLTKAFAREYGQQGVRVNAILPGVVETKFASALVENPSIQKWLSKLPAGRVGQPADMVAGVLYLASDQAAYTTGTTLIMDGGAMLG